jgi:hypothetical protein
MNNWQVVSKPKKAKNKTGKYSTSVAEQKFLKTYFPTISFITSTGQRPNIRHGKFSYINSRSGEIINAPSPSRFSHNQRTQNRLIREKINRTISNSPSKLFNFQKSLIAQKLIREHFKHGNTEGQRKALQKILRELSFLNQLILNSHKPPNMRRPQQTANSKPRGRRPRVLFK